MYSSVNVYDACAIVLFLTKTSFFFVYSLQTTSNALMQQIMCLEEIKPLSQRLNKWRRRFWRRSGSINFSPSDLMNCIHRWGKLRSDIVVCDLMYLFQCNMNFFSFSGTSSNSFVTWMNKCRWILYRHRYFVEKWYLKTQSHTELFKSVSSPLGYTFEATLHPNLHHYHIPNRFLASIHLIANDNIVVQESYPTVQTWK